MLIKNVFWFGEYTVYWQNQFIKNQAMRTVFSKEELQEELKELKQEKKAIHNKRVDLLSNYAKKHLQNGERHAVIHDLERKIETVEDKIKKLF